MRALLTPLVCAIFVLSGGCFSQRTDFADGEVACSTVGRLCPPGFSCAGDNHCYRGISLTADGRPGDGGGSCTGSGLTCSDRDVMQCQGGQLVRVNSCDVACSSGFCIACEPDTLRCNGARRQQCTDNGAWMDLDACPAATPQCEGGLCVPPCSPVGMRRCSAGGTTVEECEAAGQFHEVAECPFVCLADAIPHCGGECMPTTRQCGPDQIPQQCDERGEWVDQTACAGVCMDGSCVGECLPSDTRCASGTTVETCGATAMWGPATACPFVCDATTGDCGGVCTPDARQCSGTRAERCNTAGAWELDRDCGLLPCTGGACTPCTTGSTQCNAGIPQQCVGGDWVNQRLTACPFRCDGTQGCVGECVPGSEVCAAGDVHRTCGADAFYDDETCTFVCLAGDCAGVCEPGTRRCNGNSSQRCSSSGAWTGGMTCAFGCDTGTGDCKACVPESLEETCEGGGCGPKLNNCGTTVECPACTGVGETCGGAGAPGFCGCIPEDPQVTCQGGLRCVPTLNNCGQQVVCPDQCVSPQICGGGTTPGACGCTPVTRAAACAGKNCGTVPDGCGGVHSCWPVGQTSCPGVGETCGGGNVPNVCGCTAQCAGRECGPNGCGGTCGACGGSDSCTDGVCGPTCKDVCQPNNECGTQDNCGTRPDLDCGRPEPLADCPPAGRPNDTVCDTQTNLCKCVPRTSCSGNKICDTEPDGCGGTITCGMCPSGRTCAADQLTCECPTMTDACGARECGPWPTPVMGCPNTCGSCDPFLEECDGGGQCECLPKGQACQGRCGAYGNGACNHDCGGCPGGDECDDETNTCGAPSMDGARRLHRGSLLLAGRRDVMPGRR